MNNRMQQDVASFAEVVESAEKAAEQNEGVRVLSGILNSLHKGLNTLTGEQAASILLVAPEGFPEAMQSFNMAREQVSQYIGKVAGEDRTAGDALARRLQSAVDGDWIEDEDELSTVADLLARWSASTPEVKRGRGRTAGTSSTPTLGFTLQVKCESHGWTGRDSTSVNSARWAALKHHEKDHGGVKPAKGNPIWQGLTEALTGVAEGRMVHAQGGGYLVDKL